MNDRDGVCKCIQMKVHSWKLIEGEFFKLFVVLNIIILWWIKWKALFVCVLTNDMPFKIQRIFFATFFFSLV